MQCLAIYVLDRDVFNRIVCPYVLNCSTRASNHHGIINTVFAELHDVKSIEESKYEIKPSHLTRYSLQRIDKIG